MPHISTSLLYNLFSDKVVYTVYSKKKNQAGSMGKYSLETLANAIAWF